MLSRALEAICDSGRLDGASEVLSSVFAPVRSDDWEIFGNRWMAVDDKVLRKRITDAARSLSATRRESTLAQLTEASANLQRLRNSVAENDQPNWLDALESKAKSRILFLTAFDDCQMQIAEAMRNALDVLVRYKAVPENPEAAPLLDAIASMLQACRNAPLAWSRVPLRQLLQRIPRQLLADSMGPRLLASLSELRADNSRTVAELEGAESLVREAIRNEF